MSLEINAYHYFICDWVKQNRKKNELNKTNRMRNKSNNKHTMTIVFDHYYLACG